VEPVNTPFIAIARIARTRGNRGEVLADLHTDNSDRLDDLEEVWLEFDDGRRQARARKKLQDVWDHKGRKVLKFEGVDTISEADTWAGCWVMIPAEQIIDLPEGTYFNHDLVGCTVCDIHGTRIGKVSEVLDIADNSQLVVRGDNREYLIPAVRNICVDVSIPDKRIIIDPPEGLLDLGK
jgi:16S rRNA processing protein RimM